MEEMASYIQEMTSYSRGMASYTRGIASYSRGMASYSRGMTSYTRGMASYSRGMTFSSCGMGFYTGGRTLFRDSTAYTPAVWWIFAWGWPFLPPAERVSGGIRPRIPYSACPASVLPVSWLLPVHSAEGGCLLPSGGEVIWQGGFSGIHQGK